MTSIMDFVERYAANPRPRPLAVRPETLARCERMVGEAAYMRWYLRAAYGHLHT